MLKPPLQRRLRYWDLVALGIVHNRPSLANWIRDRGFPPGQLTGPNSRTWGEDEVQRWLDSRPVGKKPIPKPGPGKQVGRPRKTVTGENSHPET